MCWWFLAFLAAAGWALYTAAGLVALSGKVDDLAKTVSEFAAKQNAVNARIEAAVEGVRGDVAELNKKIEQLQNSPGALSPGDQALLDEIEAKGDAIAVSLETLDASTPPIEPPPPVE